MHMKTWLAAVASTMFLAGNAIAADPTVYEEVVSGPHDWSGFYVGAHIGYGEADVTGAYSGTGDFLSDDDGSFDLDPEGILGGVQVGYNWQTGSLVYGVEADITATDWSDELINGTPELVSAETDLVATLRARAGYAMDRTLIFGTAGVAWTDTEYYVNDHVDDTDPSEFGTVDFDNVGLVVGGGVEYALNQRWSLKAEGLYFLFDDDSDTPDLTHDSASTDFVELDDAWMIRIGANYHF